MLLATRGDRSSIPAGMLPDQNDIGSPNTWGANPTDRRCAAAARP
jgi:hypothetical protein